jgi:hypothetical protein
MLFVPKLFELFVVLLLFLLIAGGRLL